MTFLPVVRKDSGADAIAIFRHRRRAARLSCARTSGGSFRYKICAPMRPYQAISCLPEAKKIRINDVLWKGCGAGAAACPSGSIRQNFFEGQEIYEEGEGILA